MARDEAKRMTTCSRCGQTIPYSVPDEYEESTSQLLGVNSISRLLTNVSRELHVRWQCSANASDFTKNDGYNAVYEAYCQAHTERVAIAKWALTARSYVEKARSAQAVAQHACRVTAGLAQAADELVTAGRNVRGPAREVSPPGGVGLVGTLLHMPGEQEARAVVETVQRLSRELDALTGALDEGISRADARVVLSQPGRPPKHTLGRLLLAFSDAGLSHREIARLDLDCELPEGFTDQQLEAARKRVANQIKAFRGHLADVNR